MLRLDRIAKFRDGRRVLAGVTLAVEPGECVGVTSADEPAGSLLVRIAATLVAPDSGSVVINGIDARSDVYGARLYVAYAGPVSCPEGLSVGDYVSLLGRTRGRRPDRTDVRDGLARVGLDDRDEVAQLCPEARHRLAVAAAGFARAPVLLLDGVLQATDPQWLGRVLDVVRVARDAGTAVLLAGDGVATAQHVCDRVVRLDAGTLIPDVPGSWSPFGATVPAGGG